MGALVSCVFGVIPLDLPRPSFVFWRRAICFFCCFFVVVDRRVIVLGPEGGQSYHRPKGKGVGKAADVPRSLCLALCGVVRFWLVVYPPEVDMNECMGRHLLCVYGYGSTASSKERTSKSFL